MAIENIFTDASSAMTVISLITFIGILWWAFGVKRSRDFDAAAHLPFADDDDGVATQGTEKHHG
ncbi:cbb3-type cytochrome oxidase subunit 3 [Undibacterium arcticum]|uniref:Cbb3-type cytochrome oxidase subunit 3 n=1 Tax=Undibacterium arcticum TaxID=1762892 RepID=A0ABV7F4W8_9BURK